MTENMREKDLISKQSNAFFKVLFALMGLGTMVGTLKLYGCSYGYFENYIKTLTNIPLRSILSPEYFIFLKNSVLGLCGIGILITTWLFTKVNTIHAFFKTIGFDARLFFRDSVNFIKNIFENLTSIERVILGFFILTGTFFMVQTALLPLRSDEATVLVSFASKPYWMIPCLYNNVGNHIFHTLLMKMSVDIFGYSPLAIRLPVLLAGIASLPLIYLVFTTLYTRIHGIGCTILAATSSPFILFAGNSRGYMIQVFLTLCIFGLSHYLRNKQNKWAWLLWMICGVLTFWTVPTAIYINVGIWMWVAYNQIQHKGFSWKFLYPFILSSFLLGLSVIILYMPPFVIAKGLAHMSVMINSTQSQQTPLFKFFSFLLLLIKEWTFNWKGLYELSICMACIGFLRDIYLKRFLTLFVVCGLLFVSSFIFMTYERLYLVLSLIFYACVASGFEGILKKYALMGLVGLGLWVGYNKMYETISFNNPSDSFELSERLIKDLKPYLKDGDMLSADCPQGMPLYYQLMGAGYAISQQTLLLDNKSLWVIRLNNKSVVHPKRIWFVLPKDKLPPSIPFSSFNVVLTYKAWQVGLLTQQDQGQ